MLTPNGRFKTDTSLCLTITAYHPDSWNPAWFEFQDRIFCFLLIMYFSRSISSILNGFLSFMCDTSSTHGSIETYAQKRKFAHDSLAFNIQDPVFCELFPEITEEIKQTLNERAQKTSSTDSSLDHSDHQQTSNTSTTTSTNSFISNIMILILFAAFAIVVHFILKSTDTLQ